jgi:hypothetical protein
MVEIDEKTCEDIYDIDGNSLRVQIYLVLMKILQIKNGLNSLKLCGQKVVNVVNLQMRIMLFVKRI